MMPNSEPAIQFNRVHKQYGQGKRALSNFNCSITSGKTTALLGPNGAGKSTALRILVGLTPISEGSVNVFGTQILNAKSNLRQRIGYVGQNICLDQTSSAIENLSLQAALFTIEKKEAASRIEYLVDQFDLSGFSKRPVISLSGGEKRRLDIAMGVIHKPDILVLDEPTVNLDVDSQKQIWAHLNKIKHETNLTTIFSTHYLSEADKYSDDIIFVNRGQMVASGTPEELKNSIAGETITIMCSNSDSAVRGCVVLQETLTDIIDVSVQDKSIVTVVENGPKATSKIATVLNKASIEVEQIQMSKPSLDDVYLMITGESFAQANIEGQAPVQNRRGFYQ